MRILMVSLIIFFVNSGMLFARGGWVTSGGLLLTNNTNPWFLNTASDVSYCIEIDEEHFGVGLAEARQAITIAFDYWRREFQKLLPKSVGKTSVSIAQNKYVEGTCNPETVIRFQLGKLSPKQMAFLGPLSTVVAQTVRTSYDDERLRGQGFLYVSPETGPQALGARRYGDVVANRWSQPNVLAYVLIHELGHVFGLQHLEDSGGNSEIMGHLFPSRVISHPYGKELAKNFRSTFVRYDRINTKYEVMLSSDISRLSRLFNLAPDLRRIRIEQGERMELVMSGSTTLEGDDFIKLRSLPYYQYRSVDAKPVAYLFLPAAQKVFPEIKGEHIEHFSAVRSHAVAVRVMLGAGEELPLRIAFDGQDMIFEGPHEGAFDVFAEFGAITNTGD